MSKQRKTLRLLGKTFTPSWRLQGITMPRCEERALNSLSSNSSRKYYADSMSERMRKKERRFEPDPLWMGVVVIVLLAAVLTIEVLALT